MTEIIKTEKIRQAIILAGGCGTRINGTAGGGHKCLLRVGQFPLLVHQLNLLSAFEIDSISVVVGHAADNIRTVLGDAVGYIENPRFAETNSLYSLWLALRKISGPFVLMNCDVLAHPQILRQLLVAEGSALAYDSSSGEEEEHMKVALDGPYLRTMGKDLTLDLTRGENVGLLKFDARAADLLFDEADALIAEGGENNWAPAAVSRLAGKTPIRAVDIAGLPWQEIDFPEDLERARTITCPAIPVCSGSALMPVGMAQNIT